MQSFAAMAIGKAKSYAAGMANPHHPAPPPRFVFVGGLHRTGTSLVARMLAAHPQVSGISGSPAPEDEGCYLQGAIPHTAMHGRPGHYATDPAQHLVEGCGYDRLEVRNRMLADWTPWFDPNAAWWVEKSPVNLTRARLYQQLFPTCQFIILLRHPQAMAAALGKWVDDPPATLMRYGIAAYEQLRADLPFLHAALVVRYEDLVADPARVRRALFAFLALRDEDPGIELRDGNRDYALSSSLAEPDRAALARWGYLPGGGTEPWQAIVRHPLRKVREAVAAPLA
jgi:hypothetical protein